MRRLSEKCGNPAWLATRDRNQVPRRGLTDVVRGLTDVVYGGTRRARHPCCPREASASACPWPPGEITLQSRLHRAGKISTYRVLELAQVPEILVSIPEYFRRRVQLRGGFSQNAPGTAPVDLHPAVFFISDVLRRGQWLKLSCCLPSMHSVKNDSQRGTIASLG